MFFFLFQAINVLNWITNFQPFFATRSICEANFLFMGSNQNTDSNFSQNYAFNICAALFSLSCIFFLSSWNRDAIFEGTTTILWQWIAKSHNKLWQIKIKLFLHLFPSDRHLIIYLSSNTWFQVLGKTYRSP